MRTSIAAGLLVVAATAGGCSDKKGATPKDDAPVAGGDSVLPGDGAAPDAAVLPACASPVSGTTVKTRTIGTIGSSAVLATSPPGDRRLFVVDQVGLIRIFHHDAGAAETLVTAPFLDLSADASGPVRFGGENGLLGLAFHPQYATNGQFYVFYTTTTPPLTPGNSQRDVLATCKVSATNPDVADVTTCSEVLSIPDFASNHNGGMIEFGADGFLYIGTGDGGAGGDPQRNGQNPDALLAKFLRLDVDHPANGKPYGIPPGNPFALGGGAPEVFMLGLRNPWRWSFDRGTGDLWIGDVGQNLIEEIDVLTPAEQPGANLGWSMFESDDCCSTQGGHCAQTAPYQTCDRAGKHFPQTAYTHSQGWTAIIGGQVYRGTCYPDLVGYYFYTDNTKGGLVRAKLGTDGNLVNEPLPGQFPASPASLHADASGELYITTTNGTVAHIEAGP